MSRIVYAAGLAIAALSVSAQTNAQPKAAAQDFPPRMMDMRAQALKEFDKDGDGQLNDAERKTMMEARKAMAEKMRLAREKAFDKDGDGKLSDDERKAMMEARKTMMEKLMKEREKEFDKDGDGKLNDEERKAMLEKVRQRRPEGASHFQEILKKYDKDGDGKLNNEERKAAMEARAQEMQQRMNAPAGAKPAEANK